MGAIIGIDLGTTYSVAAVMTSDGPRLIPNALGESLTPSVIAIDIDGHLIVGRGAKELQVLHPERCASLFKRHMGSDWTTELAGQIYTPEKLSSLVLASLKQDAEAHLGHSIEDAVITVPAYFHEHQRKATIHAGEIAALQYFVNPVIMLANECRVGRESPPPDELLDRLAAFLAASAEKGYPARWRKWLSAAQQEVRFGRKELLLFCLQESITVRQLVDCVAASSRQGLFPFLEPAQNAPLHIVCLAYLSFWT